MSLEWFVMRNGKPTWFHLNILMSNRLGKYIFRFFYRIELKRRGRERKRMIKEFKEKMNDD